MFNTTICGIEKADLCLLIGANPRQVSPILNARIGKMQRAGTLKVARIGEIDDQTYKILELGNSLNVLEEIFLDKHSFAKELQSAKNPMIIVGDAVYLREDCPAIFNIIHQIIEKHQIVRPDWQGFNILHNHASMVGSLDIGFYPQNGGLSATEIIKKAEFGHIKLVYLLGADEINLEELKDCFVIYQGHHGDRGANYADLIFPAAAYTEQDGIYVNLEGRAQKARKAVESPRDALEDWRIIYNLASTLNIDLGFADLSQIRSLMIQHSPVFANIDELIENKFVKFSSDSKLLIKSLTKVPINYYMTDVISRASVTMARCVAAIEQNFSNQEASK